MHHNSFQTYLKRLAETTAAVDVDAIEALAEAILRAWRERKAVYLCGNGGSAANATHLANDYLAALGKGERPGIRAHALSANPAVLTCLGNDIGYDRIYSQQIYSCGEPGDVLIVFSGSGNSPNVVEALKMAKSKGMVTAAVTAYTGGACRTLADIPIHFAVDDMQLAEDMQLAVGHMIMQWLSANAPPAPPAC